MMGLSESTLTPVPSGASVPRYDRCSIGALYLHQCIGAFHRTHQSRYPDRVMNEDGSDRAIIAASLRRNSVQQQVLPQSSVLGPVNNDGTIVSLKTRLTQEPDKKIRNGYPSAGPLSMSNQL